MIFQVYGHSTLLSEKAIEKPLLLNGSSGNVKFKKKKKKETPGVFKERQNFSVIVEVYI